MDQDGRTRFHYTCYYGYVSVSIPIQLASLALISVTEWHTSLVFKNVYNLFSPGCKTFQRCFQMTSNSLGLTLNPSPLSHTFVYSRSSNLEKMLYFIKADEKSVSSLVGQMLQWICNKVRNVHCFSSPPLKCSNSIPQIAGNKTHDASPNASVVRHVSFIISIC